jgi:MFS family permease
VIHRTVVGKRPSRLETGQIMTMTNSTTTTSISNGFHQNGDEKKCARTSWMSKSSIRFVMCGFVYLNFFMSLAIIGQFLPLFFQSKGFGGKTVGMLSSIAPLTSFLLAPVWGKVMDRLRTTKDSSSGRTVSLPLLYTTIVLSVIFQTSVIFVNDSVSMVLVKTLTGIFHAPVTPLLDAFIMDHIDKSFFGKLRLFGILGSGLGSYCGGNLLLYVPSVNDESNPDNATFFKIYFSGYNLLFWIHALLLIPTMIGILCIKYLDDGPPSPSVDQNGQSKEELSSQSNTHHSPAKGAADYIFQDFDHVLFFLIIYVMGSSAGVNDAFTYPRFREVGLNTNHMGISRMCSSIAGGIMFWFSASLSDAVGRENVLILSLVCNFVRFWLLKVMDRPMEGYIAEGIRGGIFGSFWSSSTVYASQIGPPTLRPTLLLVLNGVYNGIGRSTGSLLGGRIQAEVGTESLYRIVATTNLSVAIAVIVYRHILRAKSRHKHVQ